MTGRDSAPSDVTNGACGSDIFDCEVASRERLLAAGDLAAARQQLLSLEAIVPGNEREWKRLHSLCLALNERTRAQVYTERFLRAAKDNTAAHLASARNFMSEYANRERARESVRAALENPSSDAAFWREVAEIQYTIQDHEAACFSAWKAISLDPDDADLRELLISSLAVLRRTSELRRECLLLSHCLMHADNKDPLRWARLGRIAAEAGAKKRAKTYIDLAVGYLSDVNYGADFELVRALILTNQAKRATKHLEPLLKENSQNSWLWRTLLDTAMSRGCYSIALTVIKCLQALPYQDPEFLHRLSLTEKTALTAREGGLQGTLLRWISPHN
jgi:tetratricopeptide (TPR) repeat protein